MAWLDGEISPSDLPVALAELVAVSRIRRAFGCTPSQALHELNVLPEDFVDALLTVEAYQHAHHEMQAALARGESTGDVCTRIELASDILSLAHERRTGSKVPR